MEKKALGIAVAAALSVGIASIIIAGDVPPVATVEVKVGTTKLAKLPDGGPTYIALHVVADGGQEWLRTSNPGCVRKPVDAVLPCRKGTTLSNVDFGELNRFPAEQAQPIVNGCQPVACGVWQGQNPNQAESKLLDSILGPVLP